MNVINAENSVFLIIDVQEKLVNMLSDNDIINNSVILSQSAEIMNIPIFITEQYPKGLGQTILQIKSVIPSAEYFEKTEFNAFANESLSSRISDINKRQIVIFGIETHICVLQTAFSLINNGYEVFIVSDACGSRTEQNKDAALKRLMHAGAQIVTTEMVLFELLNTSKNPYFKQIQALIK